jgi:hypothetical protein
VLSDPVGVVLMEGGMWLIRAKAYVKNSAAQSQVTWLEPISSNSFRLQLHTTYINITTSVKCKRGSLNQSYEVNGGLYHRIH